MKKLATWQRACAASCACAALLSVGAAGTAAQQAPRASLEFHAGATGSTTMIRDLVASAQVRQLLGGRVDEEVTVTAATGPTLGLGVRVPLRPRLTLGAGVDWTRAALQAQEQGGARRLQDVDVLQAAAGVSWGVGRSVEAGAGLGVVKYVTERTGLFAEGSLLSPMIEARGAWRLPVWDERIALTGSAQMHRFITPAMRQAGGEDGMVGRYTAGARIRIMEFGR